MPATTLEALREERNEKVATMTGILDAAGSGALSEDQEAEYDKLEAELEGLDKRIERQEKHDARKAALGQPEPSIGQRQAMGAPKGPEAKKDFETLAEFMATAIKNPNDQRLANLYQDMSDLRGEQSMGEGSAGGFAVPTQFRDQLLMVEPQAAIIRGRSNVIPAGSPPDAAITMPALDQTGGVPGNVYGGVETNWIGEGDTKPATDAKLREITLQPHELAAHIPVTDKLLRNWLAASSVLERLLRGALTSAQESAFFSGNGVGKPLGFANAGATVTIPRGTAGAVEYEDIAAMVGKILMDGGEPYWLISQSVYPQLLTMTNENGQYIWQPNAVEGSPGSLMGYPVFWHQRSPVLGQVADVMIVNTATHYLIKDGSGPFIDTGFSGDDFVRNKRRIKIFTNVDAQPWLTAPFKQESGYEVSPFVRLGSAAG